MEFFDIKCKDEHESRLLPVIKHVAASTHMLSFDPESLLTALTIFQIIELFITLLDAPRSVVPSVVNFQVAIRGAMYGFDWKIALLALVGKNNVC